MALSYEEALIVMQYHLPITLNGSSKSLFSEKPLFIGDIHQSKNRHFNEYITTIGVSHNGRYVCVVGVDDADISEEYTEVLKGFLRNYKSEKFKDLISELISAGGSNTAIVEKVEKVIDEIIKEQVAEH